MSTKKEKESVVFELRIPYHEATEILDELDLQNTSPLDTERRSYPRTRYRIPGGLRVLFHQPGNSASVCSVIPRDISRSGIGFLHGSFVYTGTICDLTLPTVDGERVLVRGKVVRCAHVRGSAHDVGVAFDQLIDLRNYVRDLPDHEITVSQAQPPTFSGKALYVDDSVDDRELARFLLSRLGVEVDVASDASGALGLASQKKFDIALINVDMENRTGHRIAELLSDSFCTGPFIACTADESPQVRVEAMANGFVAVLTKPYELDTMIEVLTHYLSGKSKEAAAPEPIYSSKWSDEPMRPLILDFLRRLQEKIQRFEQLLAAKDIPALGKLCCELKASAGGYGYDQIGALARDIERLIATRPRAEQLHGKFKELLLLCKAACLVLNQQSATK